MLFFIFFVSKSPNEYLQNFRVHFMIFSSDDDKSCFTSVGKSQFNSLVKHMKRGCSRSRCCYRNPLKGNISNDFQKNNHLMMIQTELMLLLLLFLKDIFDEKEKTLNN